jgi:hypothetical protein
MSTDSGRPSLDGRAPGDYELRIERVQLDHLARLAEHYVDVISDDHRTADMPMHVRATRSSMLDLLDRLDEARRRGPARR